MFWVNCIFTTSILVLVSIWSRNFFFEQCQFKTLNFDNFLFAVGYQFDYVFDWTILKYPQIGSSSKGRVSVEASSTYFYFLINITYIKSSYVLACQRESGTIC